MTLFKFLWLRRFFRRNTKPINEDTARLWKKRLAVTYMLLGWNAFGFVVYSVYSGNSDWGRKYRSEEENNMTSAQHWSKALGIKDAKVYRMSGLHVTKYDIHNEFDKDDATKSKTVQE